MPTALESLGFVPESASGPSRAVPGGQDPNYRPGPPGETDDEFVTRLTGQPFTGYAKPRRGHINPPPAGHLASLESLGFTPEADPVNAKPKTLADLPTQQSFDAHHQAAVNDFHKAMDAAQGIGGATPEQFAANPIGYSMKAAGEHVGANKPMLPLSRLAPDHPATIPQGIAKGGAELAESFTTPVNLGLMAGSGAIAAFSKVAPLVSRVMSGGFSLSMLKNAYQQSPEVADAIAKKDWPRAAAGITKLAGTVGMAALSGAHASGAETAPAPRETPPVSVEPTPAALPGKTVDVTSGAPTPASSLERLGFTPEEPTPPAPAAPETAAPDLKSLGFEPENTEAARESAAGSPTQPSLESLGFEREPREPSVAPVYGSDVTVRVPGEETEYPAKYSVRELADVQPSHNPHNFEANPRYEYQNDRDYSQTENAARVVKNASPEVFKPDFPTAESPTAEHGPPIIDERGNVLGGNSRTMSLARVYGRADDQSLGYKATVVAKAPQLGLDPAAIEAMKQPVLVREAQRVANPQKAITDFNKGAPAALSPEERAVSDGRRLSDETVADLAARLSESADGQTMAEALRGDSGRDVINRLVNDGVITEQERGGYVNDRDELTPEAKSRISKALVGRMFESPQQFRDTPPSLRQKLERIAPQVLRVEGRKDWNITSHVREAIVLAEDARAHDVTPEDAATRMPDLAGKQRSYSPESVRIAETLNEGPKMAEYAFRRYANDEILSREGQQSSMFEPPSRQEAFRDAFGDPEPVEHAAAIIPKMNDEMSTGSYVANASDRFHGFHARVARVQLSPEEGTHSEALVVNPSALEYIVRAAGGPHDVSPRQSAAMHIGASELPILGPQLSRMMRRDFSEEGIPPELMALSSAIRNASAKGKSLIVMNGHEIFEPFHENALREEVAHAVQAQVRAPNVTTREHFGSQLYGFLHHPLATRARAALNRYERGQGVASEMRHDNTIAVEIGVRLMYPGAWKELNLSPQEARDLAAHYLRTLRKEYGNVKPREIAKHVFENAPDREAERGARSSGARPEGREGIEQRARSDVSGDGGERVRAQPPDEEQPHGRRSGREDSDRAIRLLDERGQGGLFRDTEEIARANERDRARLTKERLEAQLKAPISREEQLKKLKRASSSRQSDLFGGTPEEPQRGLFDESIVGARALEAHREGQLIRRQEPGLKLSKFSKRLRVAYPEATTADAARIYAHTGGERGSIPLSPKALNDAYQGSVVKSALDIPRRLGRRIAAEGDGAGAELMRMIERSELEGGIDAGQQFARWMDAKPSELTKEERLDITDALEGRKQPQSQKVQRVVDAARSITDEIAGEATARGVEVRTKNGKRPFAALPDYFPHTQVSNADALSSGPIRNDVIWNIERQGIAPDKASATKMVDDWVQYLKGKDPLQSTLDYLVKSGQAKDQAQAFANLQRFRKNVGRHGNIEFSREINLPFYDPDPLRVIPKTISSAARRLNQIAQFGQEHEKINAEILKIAQAGGNADFVRKSVDRIVSNIQGAPSAEERVARFAMALQTGKLAYVGVQHAAQSINTLLAADMPTFAAGMAAAFGKGGKRFSIESGAGAEPAIRDALRQAGGDSRFTDTYLRMTGLPQVMRFNRAVAANTGAKWAQKNFEVLKSGSPAQKTAASKRLENMGIDADAALRNGKLSDRDYLRAAKSMADYTMFRNRPQDLPDIFTSSPIGRVASQFKHWSYQQANFVFDQVKADFSEGGVRGTGRGIRTLLLLATVFPAAGMVVNAIKDKLNGRDREFDSKIGQYIFALMHSSALGITSEAVDSFSARHAAEFIIGPTGSDAAKLGEILAKPGDDTDTPVEAAEGKAREITKFAIEKFGGPLQRLVPDE